MGAQTPAEPRGELRAHPLSGLRIKQPTCTGHQAMLRYCDLSWTSPGPKSSSRTPGHWHSMDLGERQQRKGRETMSLLCAKEKSSGVGLAVLQTWKHLQGLLGATGYPRPAAACSPPALHHTEPSALQVRAAHGACSPGCLRCGSLHLQNQSSPEGQTCPGAAAPCPGWCLLSPTACQDHPARREEQEEGSQVPSLHARKCCEERGAHRAAQMQLLQLSASPAVAAERIAIQTHF